MASKHLSIRIDPESLERLDRESRHQRMTRSELARTLVEEGLRMEAHPGIVFRPGPAGRRPGLIAGPDVWELVRLYNDLPGDRQLRIQAACEWTSLRPDQVATALRYYADFRPEIDESIREADEYAAQAHAEWQREQEAPER